MEEIKILLVNEVRRRLMEEGVPRIKKCLSELSDEEIWLRPNENSNSVGNLVLHLCGNVRQWVLAGLDGQADVRQRQKEFDERGPFPVSELNKKMDTLLADLEGFLKRMPAEKMVEKVTVQGYNETGLTVLTHVMEHFSYHVGQITYFTKWKKNMDVGYYEDNDDLELTGAGA